MLNRMATLRLNLIINLLSYLIFGLKYWKSLLKAENRNLTIIAK